jgi:uncharacterized membrane protein YqjE
MAEENGHRPGLATLGRRMAQTALGAVRNRAELLALEWQEEKAHLAELIFATALLCCFGVLVLMLLTATLILLFPDHLRVYAAAGFTLLYLGGAVTAGLKIRSMIKHQPFVESLAQLEKDRKWLGSSK